LAQSAITKTIEEKRPWNPQNCGLFPHLAGIVRSEISNHFSSSNIKNRGEYYVQKINGKDSQPIFYSMPDRRIDIERDLIDSQNCEMILSMISLSVMDS